MTNSESVDAMWAAFARDLTCIGREPGPYMPVVYERFEVVLGVEPVS